MKHRQIIVLVMLAALAVFAGFVTWRERSTRARIELQLAAHVNAVSHAVWQLDSRSIDAYLKLAVESGNYRQLTIFESGENLFSQHSGRSLTGLDAALQRLGLITEVRFQSPISYNDAPIGRMELVWRSTTIYSEIYFLLGLALVVFLIERHLRVLEGRAALELRVAERTRQLSQVAAALSASEERLRLAVEGGKVGIWEWDIGTSQVSWNDELKRIFGVPLEATGLTFANFTGLIHPEDAARVQETFRSALADHTVCEAEFRLLRPDGGERSINARGQGYYDDAGKPISMAGVALDITERKRAEVELQHAEAVQRSIMESSPDHIILLDTKGIIRYINRTVPSLSPSQVMGSSLFDHLDPDFHQNIQECLHRVLTTGLPDGYTVDYQPRSGGVVSFDARVALVQNDNRPSGLVIVARDVTERRKTEEALRASEARFRRAMEESPFPVLIHAEDGEILALSRTWTEITGYSHADIPTIADWTDKAYGTRKEVVRADISGLYDLPERKAEGEYRITCRDGTQRVWDFSSVSLGRLPDGRRTAISMAADVTERKAAEAALRTSEEHLRLALDATRMGTFDWDMVQNRIAWSRWHEELWGMSPGEFNGTYEAFAERVHPEDRAAVNAEVVRCITTRETFFNEFRVTWPDGSVHWAQARGEFTFDSTAKPVRMRGTVLEITERKQAEAERALARQRVDLLAGLVQRLMGTETVRDAARLILQTADELFGWDASWMYVWHPETGKFANVATFDLVAGSRQEVPANQESLLQPTPIARRVMTEGAQLRLRQNEAETDMEFRRFGTQRRSLSLMFVPVQRQGELIGIISIQSYRVNAYDERALNLLSALGDHCANALHRIRTEESLRASEARLAAAQAHAHLGNWEVDFTNQRRIWSAEMYRLLNRDPALGPASLEEFLTVIHPDDVERFRGSRAQAIAACSPHHEEFRLVTPQGRVRWVETHAESIVDATGKLVRQVGTLQDITERKLAEEQIQRSGERLRLLSRRLIEIQETERRHLARELHDEIGQTLTATKLHLQNLQAAPNPGVEHKRIADAIALVDGLLQTVRSLSLNLRPPMLDDLGLVAALRWLLDQHGRTTGQTVRFEHEVLGERLDPVIETTCFRIAQEAMTNVTRHAGADCVDLRLRREDGALVLTVCDNGRGFDTEEALGRATRGGSLGLVSMEERVSLTGGRMELKSTIGKGTELTARFPLPGGGLDRTRTAL